MRLLEQCWNTIEVIEQDLDFKQSNSMFNGGNEVPQSVGLPLLPIMAPAQSPRPKVEIIEQPASIRFRYESESPRGGSIPGISSTLENKAFPAIQIIGYQGRAVVVVSCVTKDLPYRPHPHNLVGREGCKKGVCTLKVSPETMSVTFTDLRMQCVKKKDIETALKEREDTRVDPFKTGFSHRSQPTSIDLKAVRLCFQVLLEGEQRGKCTVPLTPVVSEPIYDTKAIRGLNIVKLSDCVSSVGGGRKDIILLCEKVVKEDIQIRFYEEQDGQVVWEGFGDFKPSQVHKQTAIWFRAPRYKTLKVTEPVRVFIQLRKPSDGATSEPLPFELLPLDSELDMLKRKRQKFKADPKNHVLLQLWEHEKDRVQQSYNLLSTPMDAVNTEPRDTTPSPYGRQMYGSLSPMYIANPALPPQQQYRTPLDPMGPTSPPAELQCNLPYGNVQLNVTPLSVSVLPPKNTEPKDNTPSPYGGQMCGNLSPMYTANPALFPQQQYRTPVDPMGPTPPPAELQCNLPYGNVQLNVTPLSLSVLPPINIEPKNTTPSPYGSLSPMYTANPALSPQQQYRIPVDPMSPIPPLAELQCNLPYRNVKLNATSLSASVLSPINNMLPQNWNISSSNADILQNDLGASRAMNIHTPSDLSSLLDLDRQQLELKEISLNSGELANLCDTNNLSENLFNNLSLTDSINVPRQDQNMTDSLTCFANNTIDSLCQLDDMYKPN